MSDEPKASWTKAVPQLLGIAALAVLFVVCLRNDRETESPFRQAARRLRTGMSEEEADAVTRKFGLPSLMGSLGHTWCTWIDEVRGEQLSLDYKTTWEGKGSHRHSRTRLIKWSVESTELP